MTGNLTLEETRSRLREIALNVEERGCCKAADELRQIATNLGLGRGGSRRGAKPRRRYRVIDGRMP